MIAPEGVTGNKWDSHRTPQSTGIMRRAAMVQRMATYMVVEGRERVAVWVSRLA